MHKKFALSVAALALTLLALEIGWRFYVTNFGAQQQKMLYLYSRAEIDTLQSLYRPLPFVNYGLTPNRDDVNSLGYRGPEITQPKPADRFRIVALGGSTTYGGYLAGYESAWPHKLERLLVDDYGYSQVEVVNAGVPAYSSYETAVNFLLRVQDLGPDMIIMYHATNDVRARLVDPADYQGGYELRGAWQSLGQALPASALQRLFMHRLGDSLQLAFSLDDRLPPPTHLRGCQLDTSGAEAVCVNLGLAAAQVLAANPPIYFQRNLENIISMAQSRDIATLLLTWAYSPYVYDAPNGDVMSQPFRQAAVAEHNAIIRGLAEERDTLFYDMAANMPSGRKYWFNGVHQSEAGTSEMARQLSGYLAGSGALD
ncbi:MAG: SGNH/GDSL hydrolase family protein [Chloroflexi bacterium]|nr:SGNH/GDSL hydrolase family protein [Chloroflexota bacterium]MCY3584022.1 SGNH/GDSL hydrolase family protein [Chloroflexota bacterium]MCY3717210.1 SGNH/GDSL hydrolase family protein [Chloroflexota bacterium]MDE2651816.1 SGNH/GDSL hydrolase family protein [Chloroflexota bacterium]MXV93121.1 hypothetical protein [Chloroflexota bacterium]